MSQDLLQPLSAIDTVGFLGAALTTLCWLPQALKSLRERNTQAISLSGTTAFALGISCWLVYGMAREDAPLVVSSAVTLALVALILALKLRHG